MTATKELKAKGSANGAKRTIESLDDVEGVDTLETVEVYLPQWDMVGIVSEMDHEQREWLEESSVTVDGEGETSVKYEGFKTKVVGLCWINSKGERICEGAAGKKRMGKLNSQSINLLFDAAAKLNKLTKQTQDEVEGNSEAARTGGDSSISQ